MMKKFMAKEDGTGGQCSTKPMQWFLFDSNVRFWSFNFGKQIAIAINIRVNISDELRATPDRVIRKTL